MVDQKDVQKKLVSYQVFNSQIKALNKRRELLLTKILEIENTFNSIEEIEKSKDKEILLPLGSNVHIPGTLKKRKKMIVELGANIAIQCETKKAKDILNKRKDILENGLKEIEENLMELSKKLSILEPEIQKLLQKSGKPANIKAG